MTTLIVDEVSDMKSGDSPVPPGAKVNVRERNKAEKLARIKDSAKRLFKRSGYEATTTKEIADDAGVAAGTVFLYAKTKDEILFLIFEDEISRIHDEGFARIPENATPVHGAEIVFAGLLTYYSTCPELARSFVRRFVFVDSDISERYKAMQRSLFERLSNLVTRSQEKGETRTDVDAKLIVANIWGIYISSLVLLLRNDHSDIGTSLGHLKASFNLIEEGLRPR